MNVASYVIIMLLVVLPCRLTASEMVYLDSPPICDGEIKQLVGQSITDASLVADSVSMILENYGYLESRINQSDDTLVIFSGNRFLLSEIIISGDAQDSLRPGIYFVSSETSRFIDEYLQIFQDSGYFYSRLSPHQIRVLDSTVQLEMELVKGPLVYIDKYNILGLSRSDPYLVNELLSISDNQLLTARLVSQIETQACAINYIEFVPPVAVLPSDQFDRVDMILNFRERIPLRFDGGFGYLSGPNSEFIWSGKIDFQNMFGRGKNISLNSSHPDKSRTTFEIEYRQPMLSFGRGEMSLFLSTRDYRDQFYEFESRIGYRGELSQNHKYQLCLGWKRSEPVSIIEPSFDRYLFSGGVEIDLRDNRVDPSDGFHGVWNVEYRYRRNTNSSIDSLSFNRSFNDTRALFTGRWYQPIWGNLKTIMSIHYEALFTSDSLIPLSELVRVGGPPVLRGFRNEQFVVGSVVALTLQPYLRFDQTRLGLFVDAAYLNETGSDNSVVLDDDFYRFGFGLDFTLFANNRSINLSLGWNKELAADEPMLSVRFISAH